MLYALSLKKFCWLFLDKQKKYSLFLGRKPKDMTVNIIKNHHLLHAYSSFFWSDFNKSAILCVDWFWYDSQNIPISQSLFYGNENEIICIKKMWFIDKKYKHIHGIWHIYSFISKYIWLEEWSVMWLAPYGNYEKYSCIDLFLFDGINTYGHQDLFQWIFSSVDDEELDDTFKFEEKEFVAIFQENIKRIFWITQEDYIQRKKDITKSKFADIAAKLQYETERAMVHLANYAHEVTSSKNLCLAWWVALNINANTRILQETPFEKIFVQPAATDDGLSLWAAYYGYHTKYPDAPRIPMVNASLGKCYWDKEILHTLLKYQDKVQYSYEVNSYIIAAEQIKNDKIIGWFYAGSEFGPRALWNRSILANSNSEEIRDRVNGLKNVKDGGLLPRCC